jgi:hypothetical protein
MSYMTDTYSMDNYFDIKRSEERKVIEENTKKQFVK